ncbi:MAG: extracellular solute-binding protein [Anaerolineae bacterium]|nr:extracellular solute-binding protein [Anaerolineae bacterium]
MSVQAQTCDGTVIPIDFTNVWGAERQVLMDEIIATFESQNPCIDVINEVMPLDGYAEQIATRLLSSDPPAVIMSARVQTYQYASEGRLQSLSPYLEAAGIDVYDVFYESEINNQMLNGEVWALPMPTAGGNTSFFFYNKDLVAQAGLDPEVGPQTWDDMITLAEGVNKIDARGIEVIATFPFGPDINSAFASWLASNGGQYLSDDGRQVLFNSERGVETLQWLVDYTNNYFGGLENMIDFFQDTDDNSADFPFYQDTMALWFGNTSQFNIIKTWDPDMYNDTARWGVGLRPYNSAHPEAVSAGVSGLAFTWGYVIPAALPDDVKEAAFKWIAFLGTDPQGGCQFMLGQQRPSPVRACNENSVYSDINPYWDTVLDAFSHEVSLTITPVQSQITDIVSQNIQGALLGTKTVEQALNDAAAASQALLDEYWAGVDAE